MAAQTRCCCSLRTRRGGFALRARRHRRPDGAAQAAVRRNISTTRPARSCSRTSRALPEYYPTRCELADPARARGRHGALLPGRLGADRIRQRLEQEGAHPARRRRRRSRPMCRSTFPPRCWCRRRTSCGATIRSLPCCRSRPTSRSRSRFPPRSPAWRIPDSFPDRPSAISSRTRPARSCATPGACWDAAPA